MLAVPDRATPLGRRNYALLLFLYNTGARATEAAELPVSALSLDAVPAVRILGKGRKFRHCPLWPHTCSALCLRSDRRAHRTRASSSTFGSSR